MEEKLILAYNVSQTTAIDKGADQVEVLRRVRAALPDAFSDAVVRTRID